MCLQELMVRHGQLHGAAEVCRGTPGGPQGTFGKWGGWREIEVPKGGKVRCGVISAAMPAAKSLCLQG